MVAVTQRDDLVVPREAARGKNGDFIRLGPAVREKRFREFLLRRDFGDALCQRNQWLRGEDGRHMLKRVQLRVNLRVHVGVAMPDGDGDDAAEEVEVLVPVRVINELVPGS